MRLEQPHKKKSNRTHKVERLNNIISNDKTEKKNRKKTIKNLSQTRLIFETRVLGYEIE
jgi:transposase-like protein